MSKRRGGSRSRRFKRDQKYTIGVDISAPDVVDSTHVRIFLDGKDITEQVLWPDSGVIDGTAVPVEKDPARLLNAGGSES